MSYVTNHDSPSFTRSDMFDTAAYRETQDLVK